MAKLYLALICLFTYSLASDCTAKNSPSGAGDCEKLAVDTGYKYCCYVYTKYTLNGNSVEHKGCEAYTQAEYDKIGEEAKKAKEKAEKEGFKNLKLDIKCQSGYLQYYLTSLLLLLIL